MRAPELRPYRPPRVGCTEGGSALRPDKCADFNRFSGENGAQSRNRTSDTAIFSRMLYQLSYLGPAAAEATPETFS